MIILVRLMIDSSMIVPMTMLRIEDATMMTPTTSPIIDDMMVILTTSKMSDDDTMTRTSLWIDEAKITPTTSLTIGGFTA